MPPRPREVRRTIGQAVGSARESRKTGKQENRTARVRGFAMSGAPGGADAGVREDRSSGDRELRDEWDGSRNALTAWNSDGSSCTLIASISCNREFRRTRYRENVRKQAGRGETVSAATYRRLTPAANAGLLVDSSIPGS